MLCREQVAELRPHLPAILGAGARLVVIGSGGPHFVAGFRELLELPPEIQVLCDPDLASYRLLGFRHGAGSTLGYKVAKHGLRALRAGFRQGKTQGDPFQQGGVLVVLPSGQIAYHYASEVAGDHPPPQAIVDALRRPSRAA